VKWYNPNPIVITEATYFSRSKMLNWVGRESLLLSIHLTTEPLKKRYLQER
jgi:hypothetical protein